MTSMHAADAPAAPAFQVHAYPRGLRLVRIAALVLAAANIAYLSAIIVSAMFTGALVPPPLVMAGWLVAFSFIPFGVARLLGWLTAATLSVEPERLVLERRRDRFEIPLASVESILPWRLPLPGAGLSLRMKSGRTFQYEFQAPDPLPLLEALGRERPEASAAARHPNIAFGHARHVLVRGRWYHLVLKFVLFPLLPTVIMFRAHQYITYGGPFGQYQMYGLKPYLLTFASYWISFITQLVLYAGIWRGLFELVALAAAWLSPPHARGVRRFVEVASAVLYYLGFPALVVSRFFL